MYFSKHYDVAFFEITGGLHLQSLPLEGNSEFGQEAFVLVARDTNLDLIYREAKLASVGPCEFQHNHYKFITCSIPNKVIIFVLLYYFYLILSYQISVPLNVVRNWRWTVGF